MLTVMRSVRCGRSCRLSGCGVSSFRSSLVSSLSFPRSGSPCLPVASVLPCVVLAPPRRHAVGGEGIISSSLALLVRYGERGAGSGRGLLRWAGHFRVRSMWYHHASFLIGGRRVACFVVVFPYHPIVLVQYRIAWRGRLLGKTAGEGLVACLLRGDVVVISPLPLLGPSPNRPHISCGSRMYPLSLWAIDFAPPLVSNKTGSKTGRDLPCA